MNQAAFSTQIWSYIAENWSDILVLLGFGYYVSARVLGILPLTSGKKELLDALLSFLDEQLGGGGEGYHFSEDLMEELREHPEEPEVLTKIAKDILAHCQVEAPDLHVKMGHENLNSAGIFYKNEITINQTLHMRKTEMLAVLIHECMLKRKYAKDVFPADIKYRAHAHIRS